MRTAIRYLTIGVLLLGVGFAIYAHLESMFNASISGNPTPRNTAATVIVPSDTIEELTESAATPTPTNPEESVSQTDPQPAPTTTALNSKWDPLEELTPVIGLMVVSADSGEILVERNVTKIEAMDPSECDAEVEDCTVYTVCSNGTSRPANDPCFGTIDNLVDAAFPSSPCATGFSQFAGHNIVYRRDLGEHQPDAFTFLVDDIEDYAGPNGTTWDDGIGARPGDIVIAFFADESVCVGHVVELPDSENYPGEAFPGQPWIRYVEKSAFGESEGTRLTYAWDPVVDPDVSVSFLVASTCADFCDPFGGPGWKKNADGSVKGRSQAAVVAVSWDEHVPADEVPNLILEGAS